MVAAASIVVLSTSVGAAGPVEPLKSKAPANINPDKQPVPDLGRIKPDPAPPLTARQQQEQARSWAAKEPNARIVCTAPDGTVAGTVILDKVDPRQATTRAQAAEVCSNGFPGSRP
jgi:hypothetical protein